MRGTVPTRAKLREAFREGRFTQRFESSSYPLALREHGNLLEYSYCTRTVPVDRSVSTPGNLLLGRLCMTKESAAQVLELNTGGVSTPFEASEPNSSSTPIFQLPSK